MKLMLRPEWRLWPLSSFFGLLDLKTGVTVALLFALLNKVAGVYGLIAVFTGAGGSFAQLSLYIYSVVALLALAWALRAVKDENPKQTLYFAHLFAADHVVSTAWTVFFAVIWWVYTPHDGRRQANSEAQKKMMEAGNITGHTLTPEEREQAAMAIWDQEKGTAAAVIIISWLFKIYFALLLYSYATHLRKGSYRSLPLSRSSPSPNMSDHTYDTSLGLPDEEDEEIEDFYRVPLRTPRGGTSGGGSISSFADFVSAPGRTRKPKVGASSLGNGNGRGIEDDNEVLFDEDQPAGSRGRADEGGRRSASAGADEESSKGVSSN